LYERWLAALERHRPPGRLLDIGCGTGLFLVVARRRGRLPVGIADCGEATRHAGKRFGRGVGAGGFESSPPPRTNVEPQARLCFYSTAAARALRRVMACAVEKADKTRTAAFYLARARALRHHGQFTDSAEKRLCSCGVSSAQGFGIR